MSEEKEKYAVSALDKLIIHADFLRIEGVEAELAAYKQQAEENKKLLRINKGLSKFIGMIEAHLLKTSVLTAREYDDISDEFTRQERKEMSDERST